MPKKPAKPDPMKFTAGKPPNEAEASRLYESHFLARYLKVVIVLDGDAIEVVPRQGHHLSIVYRTDTEGRRQARLLIGPTEKPKKPAPAG